MIKRLRYFRAELRRSLFFNIVLFLGTILCVVLIALCVVENDKHSAVIALKYSAANDRDYIVFSKYPETITADVLREKVGEADANTLATACTVYAEKIGGEQREAVIMSLTAANKLPALGLHFSESFPIGYREAYVNKDFKASYKKGEIYDIELTSGTIIPVKIKGYLDGTDNHYVFGRGNIFKSGLNMVICAELPGDAELRGGIFFNDKSSDFYSGLGFTAMPLKQAYRDEPTAMPYFSVMAALFLFSTVFINYMINLDKTRKRFSIMHIVGIDRRTLILTELIKMAAILIMAVAIGFAAAAALIAGAGILYEGEIINYEAVGISASIVFAAYAFTVACGMAGLMRIKPLAALKDEVKE